MVEQATGQGFDIGPLTKHNKRIFIRQELLRELTGRIQSGVDQSIEPDINLHNK